MLRDRSDVCVVQISSGSVSFMVVVRLMLLVGYKAILLEYWLR